MAISRKISAFLLMLFPIMLSGQGKVIINEVMASCHKAHADEYGESDDWLELRSLSSEYVDIAGMFFVVEHELWEIPQGRPDLTRIPPNGYAVLWFDGQDHQGAMHAPFRIPRSGATILLIDYNGSTLLDAFTYSEQRTDISYGRSAKDISTSFYYEHSTPGEENAQTGFEKILEKPVASISSSYPTAPIELELNAEYGEIYYTLDARSPRSEHALRYDGPIYLEKNTVVRAICKSATCVESDEFVRTYIFSQNSNDNTISLVVDPKSLWGDSIGIYVDGNNDNFSQRGEKWRRQASITFHVPECSPDAYSVDLSISGNGSRSLPKKSFSIHGHKRYGSNKIKLPFSGSGKTERYSNFKLRADAAGGCHLKERFIYALNEASGGRADMQESLPFDLYLNGQYWGLYELMPSKGPAFLQARSGERKFDILTGVNGSVKNGDRKAYVRLLELANDPKLATGTMHAELVGMVDLDNFIDYWIFEIFSGKVDNSTNLRYYRPKSEHGRWRWITYDMDLWGDPHENTLARVLDRTDLHEYALPGLLIQDPLVKGRFINRFADLLNTSLRSTISLSILEEVERSIHDQKEKDRSRWSKEMYVQPDDLEQMKNHLNMRPEILVEHIEQRFDVHRAKVQLELIGPGKVKVNSLMIEESRSLRYFSSVQIRLEAIPKNGYEFAGWSGSNRSDQTVIYVEPSEARRIKAKFVKKGSGGYLLEDGFEEGASIGIP